MLDFQSAHELVEQRAAPEQLSVHANGAGHLSQANERAEVGFGIIAVSGCVGSAQIRVGPTFAGQASGVLRHDRHRLFSMTRHYV
ncbi:hypothetical protein BSZ19_47090 [Bradyrhizobium japonicum]|uniref:Uncharacterized protein n=1 Tax=Bradyrhizobium japonicum TaxID=375 RepID=A0A1Y2J7S1_BRAJP|nr:hypothetical protein BSZ19_47090 [Bradyrhizobium japonicum]